MATATKERRILEKPERIRSKPNLGANRGRAKQFASLRPASSKVSASRSPNQLFNQGRGSSCRTLHSGLKHRPGLVPHPRHRSATPGCAGIPSPSRDRGTPSNPPDSHPGVLTVRRRPGVILIVEWVGMVGRPGFEPGTNNLKGCCSTIELSTPTAPTKRGEYVSPARIGKPFFPKAMPRLTPKACDLRTPSIAYRSQSNTLFQRFTLWEQSNTSRVRRRLNACQPKLKKSL